MYHSRFQGGYLCSFGAEEIDINSGVFEWKIRIKDIKTFIKIGVINQEMVSSNLNTYSNYQYGYGYNSTGQKRNNGDWKNYGSNFYKDDVITTIFDSNTYTLSFKHNEKDLGIAYTVAKTKRYRFVVESYGQGDHYELLDE